MELKNLKTGLFGFTKKSVYQYISELNNACAEQIFNEQQKHRESLEKSQKNAESLQAEAADLKSENAQLQRRLTAEEELIAQLRNEVSALQQKLENIGSTEQEVTDILKEAKAFSEGLKEKAAAEYETACAKNREKLQAQQQKLNDYSRRIALVGSTLQTLVQETHCKVTALGGEVAALKVTALENDAHEA